MTRYRGRHRAPTNTARRATVVALATGVSLSTASPAFAEAPENVRQAIISCESGGDPRADNPSPRSTASGLYQFIDGTWQAYGGSTARARDASVAEQTRVFERAYAAEGTKPWEADPKSENCWRAKLANGDTDVEIKGEGKRSNGKTAEQSDKGKRRSGTEIPDGYTVKRGDTLGKLAREFNVDGGFRAIAKANDIADPNRIYVGQTLK